MDDQILDGETQKVKHFHSISQFLEDGNFKPPEHPMFYIHKNTGAKNGKNETPACTSDFYVIFFKKLKNAIIKYGRTKYDFEDGALMFSKPEQLFACKDDDAEPGGYLIMIHKDFFNGTELFQTIKRYGFFEYSVNEALHLSPSEEQRIINLCENLQSEYQNNQDQFSKEIIISHLSTLFKYSDRFYRRQFLNREDINIDIYEKFNNALLEYSKLNLFEEKGLPNISWIAEKLSLSSRYLSDSLKSNTGKTATELINLFIIDEAKNMLLEPNATISKTAYKLGFEYPQYFSRLFKRKVGLSPKEYIANHSAN